MIHRGGWLGLALALGACSGAGDDSGGDCDRSPPLSWHSFGQGFMGKHCTGCHSSLLPDSHREGAPASVNFDTYADVVAQADRIAARALGDEPTMPPGGGPSAEEQALLAEWLRCGVAEDEPRLEVGR